MYQKYNIHTNPIREGKMRAAIYTRVSTNDQSPEMRISDLRQYCMQRSFDIYKEYLDKGISRTKDSRPALNELMADAKREGLMRYCAGDLTGCKINQASHHST